MPDHEDLLSRPTHRLSGFDYSSPGGYFVTICCGYHRSYLGKIIDGEMELSEAGRIVRTVWKSLPDRFPHVELDEFVVMSNHVHGILLIQDVGIHGEASHELPQLGSMIRAFKGASTALIRKAGVMEFAWQPNFHDHIIRNDADLQRRRRYIVENPLRWQLDEENPEGLWRSQQAR